MLELGCWAGGKKTMDSIFKKVAMIVIVVLSTIVANAQTTQEVVYLKNGSIIRGIIIEQVPNESLKIQTADGSLFVYKMDEVQKITKEIPTSYFSISSSNPIQSGYRGFADIGYTIGTGNCGEDHLELSTSHGYQINPYIFVGGGAGVNYFFDAEAVGIPVFAHVRSEFLKSAISPFFEFKIGYSFLDADGVYFCPSIGCHFQISDSFGLSASLGNSGSEKYSGLSLKFGIDF